MTPPQQGWLPDGGTVPPWPPGPGAWVADAIPAAVRPPAPHRRHRLVVAGTAVAVAVTAAGVVTWQVLTSGPDSPEEAAEAFLAASQRYDWPASWELLCHPEKLEAGSLDRYIRTRDAAVATVGPLNDGLTVTVGDARPHGRSSPQSYVVDVELSRDGETHHMEVLVVEEDGGFRACGTP